MGSSLVPSLKTAASLTSADQTPALCEISGVAEQVGAFVSQDSKILALAEVDFGGQSPDPAYDGGYKSGFGLGGVKVEDRSNRRVIFVLAARRGWHGGRRNLLVIAQIWCRRGRGRRPSPTSTTRRPNVRKPLIFRSRKP